MEGSVKFEWFSRDSPEFLKALIKISAVCTLDVGDSQKVTHQNTGAEFHASTFTLPRKNYGLSLVNMSFDMKHIWKT